MGTMVQKLVACAEARVSLSRKETMTENIPVEVNQEVEEGTWKLLRFIQRFESLTIEAIGHMALAAPP